MNLDKYKLKKTIRVTGLIAVISYMTVILIVWIYTNIKGYVYFSAGEPNLIIKYFEWLAGFIGLITSIELLRMELKDR